MRYNVSDSPYVRTLLVPLITLVGSHSDGF
jgi:hypothetical protein